jgi:hypothetical protein
VGISSESFNAPVVSQIFRENIYDYAHKQFAGSVVGPSEEYCRL